MVQEVRGTQQFDVVSLTALCCGVKDLELIHGKVVYAGDFHWLSTPLAACRRGK